MRMSQVAATVASIALWSGAAQSAGFVGDTVEQGQYKIYNFDFGSDSSPMIGADSIGFYGSWVDLGDGSGYIAKDSVFPSILCSGSPSSCTGVGALGVQFLWASYGNHLTLYVRNATSNYNNCNETHAKFCYENWNVPVTVRSYTPTDGYTVSITTGAVPEPATWAMMIAGFGLVGATLRRRRPALAA